MRELSISITDFIKKIALEITEEYFEKKAPKLEQKIMTNLNNKIKKEVQKAFTHDYIKAKPRAQDHWTQFEDDQLINEIAQAIFQIAQAHKRSEGAIRSRINKLKSEGQLYRIL